ncbi:fascetto [Carabus blaptoides fortunei]
MDIDTSTNTETVDYSNREILTKMIHKETVTFLTKLDSIWDEMGIEGELRSHRGSMVVLHITDLFNDILTEANECKTALCEKITAMLKDLCHLERELQIQIPYDRAANVPLRIVKKGLEEHLQHLDFEKKVINDDAVTFKVTEENMRMLDQFYVSLKAQLDETRAKIQELREKVSTLWERLEESPEHRSNFMDSHPGNSVQTLKALKEEVVRCEELKKANIKIFIDKMRHEMVYWWDKCRYNDVQRQAFINFNSNCYTEDLLTLHEMEVEKLRSHYEKNK